MGSCASVHHKSTQESAIKLGVSFGSKRDNLVIPESPVKDKHVNGDPPIKTLDDYGSKDETFFDSQPWLESDCEDDFFSVNGEFTPSRGSTPIHYNFFMGTPKINKTPLEDRPPGSIPEPSPTGKKKRLSELFKESLQEESVADDLHNSEKRDTPAVKKEVKPTILDVLPKSPSSTPYISGANSVCSSERTANGDALLEREKSIKSAQCCLPSLISCRSFGVRKKKMSPAGALAVNDKA